MQSKFDVAAPPRSCDICKGPLEPAEGSICTGCREGRAAEVPAVVTQQVDLTGRVRSLKRDIDQLVLDYARHCETCPQCSRLFFRNRRS